MCQDKRQAAESSLVYVGKDRLKAFRKRRRGRNRIVIARDIISGSAAPRNHPLLGHLTALRDDPLDFLTRCAQTGADVVPLRLPFLRAFLLLDPADIERVLVTDHRQFVKPLWLRTPAVRRLLGDGLVTSDGAPWRTQRRACQPAFHPGLLPDYGRTLAALAERTLDGWAQGQTRDVPQDMTRLTLGVIGQTLLGTDIGARASEIGAVMDTLMACFSARRSLFGLIPLPPTRREARAVRQLDRLVDSLIADGGTGGGPETLLSRLRAEPGKVGDPRNLREQVKTFLAAGHESSALALTWAFLLLAAHPEADARLAEEVRAVLGDRPPAPEDLPHLMYTQAVVKETLRLYPPLWMTGRRSVGRCEIGGRAVPAGSLVLTSQWAVHRLARFFPRPDEFRPERWEEAETASLPRFAYFPFGGGPRVCIGQGFAMMEISLLLAAVVRRFRLETVGEPRPQPWATMTLRPPADLRMRLMPRIDRPPTWPP